MDREGFKVFRAVLPAIETERLRKAIDQIQEEEQSANLRDILKKCRELREIIACGSLKVCLPSPRLEPVRSILFDKTLEANWPVARHQDLTIAVKERRDCEGYGPWSEKDGVIHVQAPELILQKMVALRIHLDHTHSGNGALKVIPGSHHRGKLNADEIADLDTNKEVTLECDSGDVIGMRPLLVHSSGRSETWGHRRVIHIEYAPLHMLDPLLEWPDKVKH